MACKADTKYNLAPTTDGTQPLVYSSARPGAAKQRCFNSEDKVPEMEIKEWADFMKEHGIQRAIGLLSESELETYVAPLLDTLKGCGMEVSNLSIGAGEGGRAVVGRQAVTLIDKALEAKEKVVVFCWGGGKRSGSMLAAWLSHHKGLPIETAAEELERVAKASGSSRAAELAHAVEFSAALPSPSL